MRGPFDDFWPALAILLLAALIGLGALWYFTRSEERAVPAVTGQPLDVAVSRLQDEGFETDIVNRANAAPRGTVFEQRPICRYGARRGKHVTILASTGPATVVVPNAVGLPEQQARDRLASAGLEVRVFEVFSDEPEGTVIAQNPGSGERVSPDASVRLNVSKGTGLVVVPTLVGLTRAEAEAQLSMSASRQMSSRCRPSSRRERSSHRTLSVASSTGRGRASQRVDRNALNRLTTLFLARGCARAAKGSGL